MFFEIGMDTTMKTEKHLSLTVSPRKILALLLILLTATMGCTGLKTLRPAFAANQQNLAELKVNVSSLIDLLDLSGQAVFDMQIETRRALLCDNLLEVLQEIGISPTNATGEAVDAVFRNSNSETGKQYFEFCAAMNAAEPPQRRQLQLRHPVFAARLSLNISSQQIADHYAILLKSRKSADRGQLRRQIADEYSFVKDLVVAREKFKKDISQYREVVLHQQLGLALEHADLFNYAAQSNLNVEKAFANVIGDKGLQTQVLGYVHDEKVKSSLQDSFQLISNLLEEKK